MIKHGYVKVKVNHFKSKVKCSIAAKSTGQSRIQLFIETAPWMNFDGSVTNDISDNRLTFLQCDIVFRIFTAESQS